MNKSAFNRTDIIDNAFTQRISAEKLPSILHGNNNDIPDDVLLDIFNTQIMSRHLDLHARRSKGKTFYSIGSSGHEGMAALAIASRNSDMAFLHYRDACFLIQRVKAVSNSTPLYDLALSFAASRDDPVSGGRHKVLGSAQAFIPPQTSTIASHLPKAVGLAHSIALGKKLKIPTMIPSDAVVLASFGDASTNHSTAQGAFNAAQWASFQNAPMPIVFICEDNDIGISVKTPTGWIKANFENRPGLSYFSCDSTDIVDAIHVMSEAVQFARTQRRPVFIHAKTVRLMGHAGADIEAGYNPIKQIEETETLDPLLKTAHYLLNKNILNADQIIKHYEEMRGQVLEASKRAQSTPKLTSPSAIKKSLLPTSKKSKNKKTETQKRKPQTSPSKPLSLSRHINQALSEIMEEQKNIIVFGEDVARKGGVYGVTTGLHDKFGPSRIFDTLLDEQSILGLGIGMAHNGFLPIPEIQFLAYLHNAEDQIRGEAATLSFFSNGQYTNPCLIRIAGLAYQKGFGGHFHNDNSFAVLRDIPGIVIACPSNGVDGANMLRECIRLAQEEHRVVVFLEPIALYNTADLHSEGDGKWLAPFKPSGGNNPAKFGRISKTGTGDDLCILSYGNGYYLSRKAEPLLAQDHNIKSRIVDLRWLHPLPEKEILRAIDGAKAILIVDECRKTGSISEQLMTLFMENNITVPITRLTAEDSFIPLGPAAYQLLPSVEKIIQKALTLTS